MLIPIILIATAVLGIGVAVVMSAAGGVIRLRTPEEVEAIHERNIGKPAVIAVVRAHEAARVETLLQEYAKAEANKGIQFFVATIALAMEMGPFESPLASAGFASGIVGDGPAFEEWIRGERTIEATPARGALEITIGKAVAAARTPKPGDPSVAHFWLFVMPRKMEATKAGIKVGAKRFWGNPGPGGHGRRRWMRHALLVALLCTGCAHGLPEAIEGTRKEAKAADVALDLSGAVWDAAVRKRIEQCRAEGHATPEARRACTGVFAEGDKAEPALEAASAAYDVLVVALDAFEAAAEVLAPYIEAARKEGR